MLRCSCSAALERSPKASSQKSGGTDGSADLPPCPGRCRHWRRSALDGGCYSLLQSVHQVGCGEGGARQMHSGLPFADATVTRCSPQRATTRPSPAAMRPRQPAGTAPTRVLFHAAQAHPAEAPQVKDARAAGLLGGGGVGLLPAALQNRGQTGWPRFAVALARRVEHGSCLPVADQDLELLQAAPQAVPATRRPASRPAASKPESWLRPLHPSGRLGTTNAHPICIQPPMCPMENPGLAPLCRICVFVWVGVHGGLASRRRVGGVAGARVAICVRARCWAARGGAAHPRTADEDTLLQLAGRAVQDARWNLSDAGKKPERIFVTQPSPQPRR